MNWVRICISKGKAVPMHIYAPRNEHMSCT